MRRKKERKVFQLGIELAQMKWPTSPKGGGVQRDLKLNQTRYIMKGAISHT